MGWWVKLLHVAALHVLVTDGLVQPLTNLPQDLQGYLDVCRSMGGLDKIPGELVFWTAMQQYMTKFTKARSTMTPVQTRFFHSMVNNIMADVNLNMTRRQKRQAAGRREPRIRKEVRMLTLTERRSYFVAVNRLKNDRRLLPNVYDVLGDFHTGDNIARAHFGPAFPAWHRIYLWIYEGFLRQVDPSVTVPYWASVLDDVMTDSTQSVIWSDGFFGNGIGALTSGPFGDWASINPAVNITRNIGGGQLYTYAGIEAILRRRRNSEILVPTAEPDSNFELQHGGPHVYVGGTMNSLESAAFDPIFFSHHTFVDEIWERFRVNQRRSGIDPELDYPWVEGDTRFRPQHNRTSMMGFFPNNEMNIDYQNIVGYSNVFFQLVEYDPVPSCPRCGDSPYLVCNNQLQPPRCMSRTRGEMRGAQYVNDIMTSGVGRSLPPVNVNINVSNIDLCPRRKYINDVSHNVLNVDPLFMAQAMQAASMTSSTSSLAKWAYIPVKIISKRPPSLEAYQQYSLYDKSISQSQGIGHKNIFVQKGIQGRYQHCDGLNDAVGRVKLVSYGLNYDGSAIDYVVLDNRLGLSQSNGYIAVKSPGSMPSQVIVAAFDSCGRICKPYCMSGGASKRMQGGVMVTEALPLQFGNSYAEATLDSWTIPSPDACPTMDGANVPLSFFCDHTNDWVWSPVHHTPQMGPTSGAGFQHVPGAPAGGAFSQTSRASGHRGKFPVYNEPRNGVKHHRPNVFNMCVAGRNCRIRVPCRVCRQGQNFRCPGSRLSARCINGIFRITRIL